MRTSLPYPHARETAFVGRKKNRRRVWMPLSGLVRSYSLKQHAADDAKIERLGTAAFARIEMRMERSMRRGLGPAAVHRAAFAGAITTGPHVQEP